MNRISLILIVVLMLNFSHMAQADFKRLGSIDRAPVLQAKEEITGRVKSIMLAKFNPWLVIVDNKGAEWKFFMPSMIITDKTGKKMPINKLTRGKTVKVTYSPTKSSIKQAKTVKLLD